MKFPSASRLGFLAFLAALSSFSLANAQELAPTNRDVSQNAADKLGAGVRERIVNGQLLLESNDIRAITILREAAQSSLKLLEIPGDVLRLEKASLPDDALSVRLATIAADAHYQWALATDRFGRRDESVTAYSRALRLANAFKNPPGNLARDISLNLSRLLRRGLPLVAPDDVLETIAAQAHGGLWKPLRQNFDPQKIGDSGGGELSKTQFLITDGKLFPPVNESSAQAQLVQIPPLYRRVDVNRLPSSLLLDKMVAGYEKQASGPNKGQWRQWVRVFYASTFLTKDRRDDLPRAKALATQFLRVHDLFDRQLGASNLFARGEKTEGVTTLWLLEISALWPNDDDDPNVLLQIGPKMPTPNVGATKPPDEPETTSLERPWGAPISGQLNSAPGEILFWKSPMARPEAEWLREVAHEYGHVALPGFAGFRPPLEPFGNGKLGETLGMLWAAQNPEIFARDMSSDLPQFSGEVRAHVGDEAFPAWKSFVASGPNAPVARGSAADLRLLQGGAVALERIYGAKFLGRSMAPMLANAPADTMAAMRLNLNTQSLLNAPNVSTRDFYGTKKSVAIWLPGALNANLSLDGFIRRDDLSLKAGNRVSGYLWVAPGTDSLRIDGAGAGKISSLGLPFKSTDNGVRIFFAGRTGWQPITLSASDDAKIESARLERR